MNHAQLVEKFANGAEAGKASNMFIEGNVIYSYGSHFPLAVRLDNIYIINGDKYSVSTAKHTGECIHGLKPNVQIPFSALATVDDFSGRNSSEQIAVRFIDGRIKIIDNKSDWYETVACKVKNYETGEMEDGTREVHHLGAIVLSYVTKVPTKKKTEDGYVIYKNKTRYLLSGLDEQESTRVNSYFLTELPNKVSTVDEAYLALRPAIVHEAIESGIDVKRQGEWYFIPSDVDKNQLKPLKLQGYIGVKYGDDVVYSIEYDKPTPGSMSYYSQNQVDDKVNQDKANLVRRFKVFNGIKPIVFYFTKPMSMATWVAKDGTHVARDVYKLDKNIYVRGTVKHTRVPAQHKVINLGEQWHKVVKNTALGSWQALGNVD